MNKKQLEKELLNFNRKYDEKHYKEINSIGYQKRKDEVFDRLLLIKYSKYLK